MDNTQITAIRQRIIQADTEGALRDLLAWVEASPPPVRDWADTVRSLKARYRRTKQEKQKGTISYEQAQLGFNQVENDLLSVLQAIETGESPAVAPPADATASDSAPTTPWLTIGVVAALVLAGVSVFLLRDLLQKPDTPTEEPIDQSLGECPPYPIESNFNIMVLPYKPLRGDRENVESGIKDRLARSIEQYRIPAYVMTRDIDVTNPNIYPSDSKGAQLIGDPCQAQLVIWGTTERTLQNQLITTTSFRFLNKAHFNLTDFTLDQNAEVDTLETISSIASEGILTENIEAGIRLIFGLVAHETGQHETAANLIREACDSLGGVAENPAWGMVLADSYVRTNQLDKAIMTYDTIIAQNPDNTEALSQRGFLTLKLDRYDAAEADFSEILKKDSENEKARVARATARVMSNRLYEARQDLQQLESTGKSQFIPKGVEEEYQAREKILERDKDEAAQRLLRNPQDTSAMRIQAETAQKLGDFETAKSAASSLLVRDPDRIDALKTLMEIKPMLEDTEQVHELIERSRIRIPESRIPRVRPLIPTRQ